MLEQKNNVTLAGICTSTPEQRPEELLTLHSLCRKISGAVKLGLDWSKPKFLMEFLEFQLDLFIFSPMSANLLFLSLPAQISICRDLPNIEVITFR